MYYNIYSFAEEVNQHQKIRIKTTRPSLQKPRKMKPLVKLRVVSSGRSDGLTWWLMATNGMRLS